MTNHMALGCLTKDGEVIGAASKVGVIDSEVGVKDLKAGH